MFANLNEVYKNDTLYYWCNALGEINYPGDRRTAAAEAERLPAKVKELYESFQFNPHGCNDIDVYTVTYNGVDGMLLMELFSEDFICEAFGKNANEKLEGVLRSTAKELSKRCEPWGTVLLGIGTDPDGNELGVFVPADACAEHYHEAGKHLQELSNIVGLKTAIAANEHAFRLAFSLLMAEGKREFLGKTEDDIKESMLPSLFKEEDLADFAKAVLLLVGSEGGEIFSAIQKSDSTMEDTCPLCGAEVDYLGDRDLDDDGTHVSWECPHCKATGVAQYEDKFLFHNNVWDADGKLVEETD